MGLWYTIGLSLGLGLGFGVILSGLLGVNAVGAGVAAVVGALPVRPSASSVIGDLPETVAGGIAGLIGALSAAAVVHGAMRRGATRMGIAAYVTMIGLFVCLLALIPLVGYVVTVALPLLAARMRGKTGSSLRGLADARQMNRSGASAAPDKLCGGGACSDGRAPAAPSWELRRTGARRDVSGPTRAFRSRGASSSRLRGRCSPDRKWADDLAALHGRDDLPVAGAHRRRARARRRHRLRLPGGRARRAGGARRDHRTDPRARRACASRPSRRRDTPRSRFSSGTARSEHPRRAPFDGIAVAAAAPAIPPALVEQLTEDGRLVVPRGGRCGQRLVLVERTEDGHRERRSVSCRFVPLVGAEGFSAGGS